MVVPRNWGFAAKQRSPEQEATIAAPQATSIRFKVGAFILFVAWLTICFSLRHSIKHYKPRNRGFVNRSIGLFQAMPLRFMLLIPLSLGVVAYQVFISFEFKWSVINADGPVPIIYGWGYGTQLAILLVQIAYGYASPNEDKELIRQRRIRGETLDRELGLVRKPAWWRRVKGEHIVGTMRDKLRRNVNEVGQSGHVGHREEGDMERQIREDMQGQARDDQGIEMRNYGRRGDVDPRVDRAGVKNFIQKQSGVTLGDDEESNRVLQLASKALFPDAEETARRDREVDEERARRLAYITEDGPPPSYNDRGRNNSTGTRPLASERSNSTGSGNSINAPPTQIRSMLDI